MGNAMSGPRRVIVGASGSPGNLSALRYAEHLARAYDAVLIPVHTWTPPGGEIAERRSPCVQLRCLWTEDAWQRLWYAIDAAWGQLPADLPVRPMVERGAPGRVLTIIASDPADLLVVGTGRRGSLTRVFSSRVSRYCLAHAQCPVLTVPPAAVSPHVGHGPLWWVFWHRTLTPDRVLRDRGTASA
jgi:nucleotide-binding universal stress UspA family protein